MCRTYISSSSLSSINYYHIIITNEPNFLVISPLFVAYHHQWSIFFVNNPTFSWSLFLLLADLVVVFGCRWGVRTTSWGTPRRPSDSTKMPCNCCRKPSTFGRRRRWREMVGFIWIYMDLYGFIWIYMDLDGFRWIYMDLYGFIWIYVDLDGFIWI